MNNLSGFVNIIKPTGMTSSDVVVNVKKILSTKKVGHLGTLDPAASGVLPIAIGKATKFFDYFLNKDKEYVALVQFGFNSETLDSFGNDIEKQDVDIDEQKINEIIPDFIGEICQTPPKYSAIKINGKKACDLARNNADFELKSRKIRIFSIELMKKCKKNQFLFKVHCQAGTYIRTLFSDIAHKLNTNAITPVIIRTKSGTFDEVSAITIEELKENKKLLSYTDVIPNKKIFEVDDNLAKKLICGLKTKLDMLNGQVDEDEEFFVRYRGDMIGFFRAKNGYFERVVYLYENA